MNTDTGNITRFVKNEALQKAQKEFGDRLVTFDQGDLTKKQRKDMSVSLHDHRSTLGKVRQESIRAVGRNNPCPCGSGKKYKKCCLI